MATPSSHRTRVDRRDTARRLLKRDLEQLTPEERVVVERFISGGRVSRNVRRELHESRTLGERAKSRSAESTSAGSPNPAAASTPASPPSGSARQ